eukprot:9943712-Prorocentrum_lima.AAC.1
MLRGPCRRCSIGGWWRRSCVCGGGLGDGRQSPLERSGRGRSAHSLLIVLVWREQTGLVGGGG